MSWMSARAAYGRSAVAQPVVGSDLIWSRWRTSAARQSKRSFDERGRAISSQPWQLCAARQGIAQQCPESGRPRMTEELKEIGLDIGHRRVGRLMRQNGISVVRTRKHIPLGHSANTLPVGGQRRTAITSSTSHRTCWIETSQQQVLT